MVYSKDNSRSYTTGYYRRFRTGTGPWTDNSDIARQSIRLTNTITGEKLPSHEELIARQLPATTPLKGIFSKVLYNSSPIISWSESPLYFPPPRKNGELTDINFRLATHTYMDFFTTPSGNLLVQEAVAKARGSFNSKLSAIQRPFQAQVALGELRETLSFIRSPLASSLKLTRAFAKEYKALLKRSGRTKATKDLIGALSNSWLEYRFAVLPLIGDINAVLKVYNQSVEKKTYIKAFGISDYFEKSSKLVTTGYGRNTVVTNVEYKVINSIRAGGTFKLEESLVGLENYLQGTLVDASTAVVTAWELLPFSWLVDYFVNVSDILNTSFTPVSSVSWTSSSIIKQATVSQTATFFDMNTGYLPNFNTSAYSASLVTQHRQLSRSTLSSYIPPLVFTIPSSNIRVANLAALTGSLLFNIKD